MKSLSRYLFFLLDEWKARAFHRAEGSAKQKSCAPFIARMQLRKCSLSVAYFSEAIYLPCVLAKAVDGLARRTQRVIIERVSNAQVA